MDSLLLVFNTSAPVGDHIPAAEVSDDVRDNVCDGPVSGLERGSPGAYRDSANISELTIDVLSVGALGSAVIVAALKVRS